MRVIMPSHTPNFQSMERCLDRQTQVQCLSYNSFPEITCLPFLFLNGCFICFEACKVGFVNGCRPFIGLDGCHLKGKYGDILLSAISVDGNNRLLPLAFAVVESECKDSWLFFLHNLYTALRSTSDDMGCLTFMSNKQKDLTEAVREVFPDSYTRHCSRHLYANFKIHFPGDKLKSLFWAASRAYRELEFKVALSKMNSIRKDAHDWLSANPPSSWSRWAFDHRAKSGHITNNMTKSFNHWVGPYRDKPILYLIDQLWTCLMEKLDKRFKQACSYKGSLTSKIKKKLDFIYQQSRSCVALSAGHNEFEVNDGTSRFVVNLNTRKCGCQVWVATGLPCRHATCCIAYKRERVEDYCDSFYSLGKYMQAYKNIMHPLPNILELADTNIMGVVESPPLRRQPGRPPKVRKREDGEPAAGEYKKKSSSVRCDRCKLEGHNKRTYEGGAIRRKRKWSSSKTMQNRNIVGTQTDVNVSERTRSHNEATDQIDSVQARRREKMAATRARRREKEAMKLQIKD
ncbi:uncharacterized protein LOC122075840 [Macadamia integrifolia]|uniref:uncharacterized protein LOC122075840 n=1 Tax=Macadamia integrifolia TaxID=60698 RepID=UPI001C4FAADB|nr:uncharacterized protein LOC122075840 [Macadamia integrifolia]XP_042496944.1 uncharacterized protein LOC122075840 [Macadamia integrifolia]XP_042496945.1 uncharacterized protein LOC122075840 [Macadamia integrifolia]